ncbi:MAG: nucleotidyltransferase family protein, partial [Burkholderiales bacterium]|nr:nucleotidyltransferase family protein [Burkholderiales bacterium]
RGERGHPVGFAARYGAELAALAGDAGAREILRRDRGLVELIEVDDPGVLRDVDTRADLEGEGP